MKLEMIDNPKHFVIYISIAVAILVLIVVGFKYLGKENVQIEGQKVPEVAKTNTNAPKVTQKPGVTYINPKETKSVVTYDAIVEYKKEGFAPKVLEVKAGSSVRFINKAGGSTMRIVSVSTPGSPTYDEFSQNDSVGEGGAFDFNFSKKGTWLYENLNDKTKTGVIVVK